MWGWYRSTARPASHRRGWSRSRSSRARRGRGSTASWHRWWSCRGRRGHCILLEGCLPWIEELSFIKWQQIISFKVGYRVDDIVEDDTCHRRGQRQRSKFAVHQFQATRSLECTFHWLLRQASARLKYELKTSSTR